MTPSDVRALITVAGLSNREVGAALGADDRAVRRWKSGEEQPTGAQGSKLIDLASDVLAAQLIRALEIAADGRVEIARLTVNPDTISLDGIERYSQMTQLALRAAFTARLIQRGLKIERDDQ
jgi:predicted glycosyltransferase